MIKIFKYLKNSIFSILIIILLLFVQANLDLTLPEYTSKIVNIGVQQGGIENPVITDIGINSLNKLTIFMSNEDKEYVLSSYEFNRKYNNEDIYRAKLPAELQPESVVLVYGKVINKKTK